MRTPTPEQQAILDSQDRVRVVRAVPGSGKTWLVAELIRQELDKWPTKTSGIAALSFTRVGGEEIRKAVGHELGHPHFVGTIDAFLFRYIVRPFFQRCFPNFASPRLIPGEWGAENWSNYEPYIKIGDSPSSNPFRCIFINEEVNGQALVAYKPYSGRLQQLDNQAAGEVKKVKRQIWEGSGRLTHSDVAYCASKILDHKILGVVARTELIRRFPLIIVDELQDTGYFHGKSILLVLEESIARGMLVGDPDQAIYLFNGARPDLFNRFELLTSVKSFPLPESRRCSSSVATVASHLKDSGGNIRTADSNNGRAFLIRSDSMVEDIPRVFDTVKKVKHPTSVKVKIIARRKSIGRSAKEAPKLGCQPLTHLHRAVVAFRQGDQVKALSAARAAIELVIFQYEGVEDLVLEKHGIDPSRWKRLAVDCLLRANAEPASSNVYDWQAKVGHILDQELGKFNFAQPLQFIPGKLKPDKINDWDKACADYLPQIGRSTTGLADVPVQTVHGVKGETHDVTIFVCPEPRKVNHCPSAIWWSENEEDREEKRIAYVAMTRTQGDLIVCVSDACYRRLNTTRPQFVASFECLTVDEFITQKELLEK